MSAGEHGGEGDRYLIRRIREGDEEAFRQLVDRFAGRLRAYAARRLGPASADLDDVLQDTFLGIITNIGRLGAVRSLEAYLFSILRNKLVDVARRSPRAHGMSPVPLADGGSQPGVEPSARGTTPSHYVRREETVETRREVLADVLGEHVGALKAERNFRDMKVLELLFACGWKGKDVAAAAATSEPTVTRIKAEAVEKLSRLARRHPRADPSLGDFGPEDDLTGLIGEIWREGMLSCLKRSTLGAHALKVLEPEWEDYTEFHLRTVSCETCAANLEDIRAGEAASRPARERLYASSIGFLRSRQGKRE